MQCCMQARTDAQRVVHEIVGVRAWGRVGAPQYTATRGPPKWGYQCLPGPHNSKRRRQYQGATPPHLITGLPVLSARRYPASSGHWGPYASAEAVRCGRRYTRPLSSSTYNGAPDGRVDRAWFRDSGESSIVKPLQGAGPYRAVPYRNVASYVPHCKHAVHCQCSPMLACTMASTPATVPSILVPQVSVRRPATRVLKSTDPPVLVS